MEKGGFDNVTPVDALFGQCKAAPNRFPLSSSPVGATSLSVGIAASLHAELKGGGKKKLKDFKEAIGDGRAGTHPGVDVLRSKV